MNGGAFAGEVHRNPPGQDAYRHDLTPATYQESQSLLPRHLHAQQDYANHHLAGQTMLQRMSVRKMTDVLCACVFAWFCCGMAVITSIGFAHGDVRRLYHGFDYQGQLCGVDAAVVNKTLLYWPDERRMDLPICVSDCPGARLHAETVPREAVVTSKAQGPEVITIRRENATVRSYPTKQVGRRFCLPISDAAKFRNISRSIINEEEYGFFALMINSFKDVISAWSVLAFMLPLSMLVGYGYIFLLRHCARCVLYVALFALILGSGAFAYYCCFEAHDSESMAQAMMGKYSTHPRDAVWVCGVLSAIVCALLLCAACSACRRMHKVASIVETAGSTMWSVQLMLCMPILEVFVKVAYAATWLFCAQYVISNGTIKGSRIIVGGQVVNGISNIFGYSMIQKVMISAYFIGLIWGLEFISMVFKFCISYAVSVWYFQPCRADMSKPEVAPEVWKAGFTFAFSNHAGSLCLGAAMTVVLYVTTPFLVVLRFLAFQTGNSENAITKAVAYSCTCCTKCAEDLNTYINKSAIVEMVLRGDRDFFTCAYSASQVLRHAAINDSNAASLNGATLVAQLIGLVASAALGVYATFWFTGSVNIYSDRHSSYFLQNRLSIATVAGCVSIAVSMVFMFTLDLVVDTLLFCWLVEGEDDKFHGKYAPKMLRNILFDDFVPVAKDVSIDGRQPARQMDKAAGVGAATSGWSDSSHVTSTHH